MTREEKRKSLNSLQLVVDGCTNSTCCRKNGFCAVVAKDEVLTCVTVITADIGTPAEIARRNKESLARTEPQTKSRATKPSEGLRYHHHIKTSSPGVEKLRLLLLRIDGQHSIGLNAVCKCTLFRERSRLRAPVRQSVSV